MKKILQVRFVKFESYCVAQTLRYAHALPNCPFWVDSEPQVCTRTLGDFRQRAETWVSTLNSGDASVPRIERDEQNKDYALIRKGGGFFVLSDGIMADLSELFGKEVPIYTPKKYEAKWAKIFPAKYTSINTFDQTDDLELRALIEKTPERFFQFINRLQQTEANGLEVHELIVYEV